MRTPEKQRLTRRERTIVIAVAIFMFILLLVWLAMVVWMMPEPSHGLLPS